MILNGNQRGGSLKLTAHLLNDKENDHVEVHELRGFSADDLRGAFQETDAIAKGTRCTYPKSNLQDHMQSHCGYLSRKWRGFVFFGAAER